MDRHISRESELTRTTLISASVGAIVGWAIGMGQIVYMGSWEFFYWAWMPMFPIYNAIGWALYGMILGGSGLFLTSEAPRAKRAYRAYRTRLHTPLHH